MAMFTLSIQLLGGINLCVLVRRNILPPPPIRIAVGKRTGYGIVFVRSNEEFLNAIASLRLHTSLSWKQLDVLG